MSEENGQFVDRIEELETLEREFNRKESSFVVVYGRRRVGKTSLINEFVSHHKCPNIFFLATQESESRNLAAFRNLTADIIGNSILKSSDADWLTCTNLFVEFKKEERKIIVFDEFQYIGNSNNAFPSVMQKIWDTTLKNSNVMLILCGSLVSLMKQQTLDYSSPLYGRRTAQIKLKQIRYPYYKDFYPYKDDKTLIQFYAVTGGVPKYIETFRDCIDINDGIENYVLNRQSYLYEEPFFLLQNEVSEIGSYFSLISAIASGNTKISDISAYIGIKQTNVPKYLRTLINLDLIEREVPVTEEHPEKCKSGLYKITDNYIAFWFKFVYPYRSLLERGERKYVVSQINNMFIQNYVSYVYEDVCREKMWEFSKMNLLNLKLNRIGRYWGSLCGEVDILGLDSESKSFVIGECKYTDSEKGLSVLHNINEKALKIEEKTGYKCKNFVIFSTGKFSKGLEDEAKRNSSIILVDTLTPRV